MIAPSYVKPYVKRGKKNDAADAAAICEATGRPGMRFVAVKSEDRQGALILHRSRALLIRQRTMLVNALRGHMAEFGIVAPKGIWNIKALAALVADETDHRLGHRRHRGRRKPVPLGPALRRVARAGVAAELERRQGKVGADLQDGGPVLAYAARAGGYRTAALRPKGRFGRCRLDQPTARLPAAARGERRTRQQDGARRLGRHEARRNLPRRINQAEEPTCKGD